MCALTQNGFSKCFHGMIVFFSVAISLPRHMVLHIHNVTCTVSTSFCTIAYKPKNSILSEYKGVLEKAILLRIVLYLVSLNEDCCKMHTKRVYQICTCCCQ